MRGSILFKRFLFEEKRNIFKAFSLALDTTKPFMVHHNSSASQSVDSVNSCNGIEGSPHHPYTSQLYPPPY